MRAVGDEIRKVATQALLHSILEAFVKPLDFTLCERASHRRVLISGRTLTDISFIRIMACSVEKRCTGQRVGAGRPGGRWLQYSREKEMGQQSGEQRSESGCILEICRWIRCKPETKSGVKEAECLDTDSDRWVEVEVRMCGSCFLISSDSSVK